MKKKTSRSRPRKTYIPQMTPTRSQDGYRVGWFREEVYSANVHLLWPLPGSTLETAHLAAYFKRNFNVDYHGDDNWKARCTEIEDATGTKVAHCISLKTWSTDPGDIATLAHEVWHCAEQIMERRNVPHHPATSEPWAYLIESLQRRCLQMLMKEK